MEAFESAAAERADALLREHLTDEQLRQYRATGSITVVKRRVLWAWIARGAALLAATAALAALAGGWAAAAGIVATLFLVLFPAWAPSLAVALSRRRTWTISAAASPSVRVRGRLVRFCVHLDDPLPEADRILAYKHLIEVSETYFLRKANGILQ